MGYTVYLRTNLINGKQYVGQTSNIGKRNSDWRYLGQKYANYYLTEERLKYGFNNFETTILAEVDTQEEAWKLEKKYIKELCTIYPNGYNFADGGAGAKGVKHTEEAKRKISEGHKGTKHHYYGKKQPKELVEKRVKKISKPINQFTLDGLFVRAWYSAMDIERELGFYHSCIAACCKGKIKQTYGYIWKYAD